MSSTPSPPPGNITLNIDAPVVAPGGESPPDLQQTAHQPATPAAAHQEISAELWGSLARHQLLLPLLRQRVIAAAVAGVSLSEEERVEAQKAWASHHNITSMEVLQNHCRRYGLVEADLHWQAELPMRVQRYGEEHFSHRAENRFLARKNQLDQVIYSLLRVQDGALARELYLRIAEGEADFAELAARYALGPERSTRGVVGPVPMLQAHPILAELLRTSQVGQLHPPIAIEQWWLVVRLESLHPASFDEDMRRRMTRELFEEWVEEEVARWLQERRLPPEIASNPGDAS
ncbi:MAG: peptidylprolyl isomerase [Cyanobium sp.]